ncbi:MAG: hypothetical protein CME19_12845 [Gemmatimonadetes bacterium]|nr:hypothetical protein [Gemmatimonadota bacterium]|tara:strand:- start:203 stop:481 length:279 start_codon:yes stop_codon:yes gene_type:complete
MTGRAELVNHLIRLIFRHTTNRIALLYLFFGQAVEEGDPHQVGNNLFGGIGICGHRVVPMVEILLNGKQIGSTYQHDPIVADALTSTLFGLF